MTTSIGEVLNELLKNLGIERRVKELQLLQVWDKIVGEPIAKQTKATAFENGKIFVEVESASWRNELIYMKRDIIERLNRHAGARLVRDIVFVNQRK